MFVSEDENGVRVLLTSHEQATRLQEVGTKFRCPACRGPVIIKNGVQLPAHFAHKHNACLASEPESGEHLRGKLLLAKIGQTSGWNAELEVYVPEIKQRIDVLLTRGEERVALEFQCSPISVSSLFARTQGYRQMGIGVRWILGQRYRTLGAATKFVRLDATGQLTTEHLDVQAGVLSRRVGVHTQSYTEYSTWPHVGPQRHLGRYPDMVHEANGVGTALHYQSRKIVQLQNICYVRGQNLAGCPWAVHAQCTDLPGFAIPEWAARVYWLINFWGQNVELAANANFWRTVMAPKKLPLVDWPRYLRQIEAQFCNVLVTAGVLSATKTGWMWLRTPKWYDGLDSKIAALHSAGGDWRKA
ncbi:competence protein CoiA [Lacticaseibacillus hulanensis]|uniref:competence protein CoiA n=1 Tax=Lacticaseibacillus hulanensis TaxID=2493111 RepID=UPI000FD80B9E|nr:competence protein CoiA family protein [Lacticaseibacillus hulanensis]